MYSKCCVHRQNRTYVLSLNTYCTNFFGFRKGDAIDVENFQEFEELAQNIIKRKPQKITIYVDMADIQTSWRNVSKYNKSDTY